MSLTILSSNDFDKIEALKSHKSMLESGLLRTEALIKTIDKFCEMFHPELLEFLVESMCLYAQHKLS